jgi:DNA-binding SARP family transcriptional activator
LSTDAVAPSRRAVRTANPPQPEGRADLEGSIKRQVFDRFLYGLLVIEDDGRIVCHNDAAARMFEVMALVPQPRTCCALLRCSEHPLGCPSRWAADPDFIDVRHDVSTSAGRHTLWVSAFPMEGRSGKVLVQLRDGDPYDRRRESKRSEHRLRVLTLGRTSVRAGGACLDGEWLDTRSGELLRYLVVRRTRAITADEIGEALWRDASYTIAKNVRTCIHRLRGELEPTRMAGDAFHLLLTRGSSYVLNRDLLDVDVDEFESHLDAGLSEIERDPAEARLALRTALALYNGEFMADAPFAEWAIPERERLHERACHALRVLADLELQYFGSDAARVTLTQLAALQPLDESVVREIIALEMRSGRCTDAKRRYDHLARSMREALGRSPTFTLADFAA